MKDEELLLKALALGVKSNNNIEVANGVIESSEKSSSYFGVEAANTVGGVIEFINSGDAYVGTIVKMPSGHLKITTFRDAVSDIEQAFCKENNVYICPHCGEPHSQHNAPHGWDPSGNYCPETDMRRHTDVFTLHYIIAALWSTTNPSVDEGDDTSLEQSGYTLSDIPRELFESMREDCLDFQESNSEDLKNAGDEEQNGHDFWLTREGHGTGFWDRGYKQVGAALTSASKAYGSGSDEFYQHDWDIEM